MDNIQVTAFERTLHGESTHLITVRSEGGMSVTLCDFGATVVSLCVPDRDGALRDVVLGYQHIAEYETDDTYFGASVGRCCNRICEGRFSMDGETYRLPRNSPPNHLHGGVRGFSRRVWAYTLLENGVQFRLSSPDGEEGYPGNMTATATMTLDDENTFTITYRAVCDKNTVCNLTNHVYFNLNGHQNGTIAEQELLIRADHYLPIDENSIPTGEIASVAHTPFDFTRWKSIGDGLQQPSEQLVLARGFDHTFVLRHADAAQADAVARSKSSGIQMECRTTQNGIQLYTANYVEVPAEKGKENTAYHEKSAFCLETQNFPDAVNHSNFPSAILQAGREYCETTSFRFSVI